MERPFRYIRQDFFLARSFRNLEDLNDQLRRWLADVANPRVHAGTRRVVNEAFAEERPHLRPLPLAPFRAVLRLERRISREGMVSVGGNFYSVPDATRRRAVEVHKAGRGVYFCTLADLLASLARAEREGRLPERIRFFCRPSLLIVDEIGYLPVVPGGGNLFFQLVNARYERGAMILTSNRGFAEWGEVFGDPVVATALLDRLLHHAVVIQIEGSSYRLRQHAELMPEHVRSKALITPPAVAPTPRPRGRPPKNGYAHPVG